MNNDNLNRTLGQLLAQLRKGNGFTQSSLAQAMGLKGTRYIQQVEAGEVAITIAWWHRAMTAMGLHLFLLTLEEDGHCPRAAEAEEALLALHEKRRGAAKN
jgi:transcriptional regulator with XRE-family HTH domain